MTHDGRHDELSCPGCKLGRFAVNLIIDIALQIDNCETIPLDSAEQRMADVVIRWIKPGNLDAKFVHIS